MNEKVEDLINGLKDTCHDLVFKCRTKKDSINKLDSMISDAEQLVNILKRNKSILENLNI